MTGGLREGTPIVCRNCGGAMSLAADLAISFGYCGARDALPPDELGRVLEIKSRLALAHQRVAGLRGVDAALGSIFEDRRAFLRVSGVYFALALLVFALSLASFVSTVLPKVGAISARVLLQLVAAEAVAPLLVLFIALSFTAALFRGQAHYRRALRPLLVARAPTAMGVACRCRACGGDLPPARGADVRCVYCDTTNLIPKDLHGAQALALFQESEAIQKKLSAVNVATMSIARTMRATLIVCIIVSLVVAFCLPMLAEALAG